MIVTVKSKNNPFNNISVLIDVIKRSIENVDDYVEEILICDEGDFEREVKIKDRLINITKMLGVSILGKTISGPHGLVILLTSNIVENFYNNINILNNNITYTNNSLIALRTIFHEIGHAKNNYENGVIVIREIAHNYEEMLNELWNILRDEYIAEMCCANIIKLHNSIEWYGDFNDDIESENYECYLSHYLNAGVEIDGNIALQLMHQYYFINLFQKAGFLESTSKFLSIDNIKTCQTIQDILNCKVMENYSVPSNFNDIVLRKWGDFNIERKLN
ncbi:MAG: hypothetical protein WAR59_13460 [Ignavibacteriaceae bacterium]